MSDVKRINLLRPSDRVHGIAHQVALTRLRPRRVPAKDAWVFGLDERYRRDVGQ